MKLLTKGILAAFKKQGDTSKKDAADVAVIAKFFDPCGSWTWYATEYDEETRIFFGLVDGHEKELGSFGLDELAAYRGKLGLGIERDRNFGPVTLAEVMQRA